MRLSAPYGHSQRSGLVGYGGGDSKVGRKKIFVAELVDHLKKLKARYPTSDTMILIPDDEVSYREIIRAMDCARADESEKLFPNVVLSGSLG